MLAGGCGEGFQLITELSQQGGEVQCVRRCGEFPIDIEAVKQNRSGDAGSGVAADEHIDTRGGERLAPGRGAGCSNEGRGVRSRCPTDRHQNLKPGMELLELLNRGKISIERPRVGDTAHAGKIGTLVVSPGIGDGACGCRSGGYVCKGVEQVGEFTGDAILLQICDVVTGVIDTPLFEVSSENLGVILTLSERGSNAGGER